MHNPYTISILTTNTSPFINIIGLYIHFSLNQLIKNIWNLKFWSGNISSGEFFGVCQISRGEITKVNKISYLYLLLFFGLCTKKYILIKQQRRNLILKLLQLSTNIMIYILNPSGAYSTARELKNKIEKERRYITKTKNCNIEEIFFTSSGTEANNRTIKGVAENIKIMANIL